MRGFLTRIVAGVVVVLASGIPCGGAAQTPQGVSEHWKWGETADTGERRAIVDAVKAALRTSDFAKLDALETEYRDATIGSGVSKLSVFYEEITFLLKGLPQMPRTCSDAFWPGYLDRWHAASPRAPAPIIVRASLTEDLAWCHRGNGTSDTVAADGWQSFNEGLVTAAAVLEKGKAVASVDPAYYQEMESLYVPLGRSPAGFQKLVAEATSRFPYYYDLYDVAFNYALPQWGGSPADMEAVAHLAVERTRARDGTSAYFRVYWHRVLCNCTRDLDAMDWPTMKAAMADLAERRPSDWTYLHLVRMACLRGQADEARAYFAKLDFNDPVYWTQDSWDQCRSLVGAKPEPLPEALPS